MPMYVTEKTLRQADKVEYFKKDRKYVVSIVREPVKVVNGKTIGKHSPRVEQKSYPFNRYNWTLVLRYVPRSRFVER